MKKTIIGGLIPGGAMLIGAGLVLGAGMAKADIGSTYDRATTLGMLQGILAAGAAALEGHYGAVRDELARRRRTA
jgi:hypothetical protein